MAVRPVPLIDSRILRAYAEKTPGSRALHNRAKAVLPDGVTHVGRFLEPHPIYVERAAGSRKVDVDGNEYVDYLGGHGALLLGHNHPAVVQAVIAQAAKGSHYGACHALELQWAEQVQRMIPSAERVRFTVTGTEATHLALRVARAFTGKQKIFASPAIFTAGTIMSISRMAARLASLQGSSKILSWLRRMTWSGWSTGSLRAATSQP